MNRPLQFLSFAILWLAICSCNSSSKSSLDLNVFYLMDYYQSNNRLYLWARPDSLEDNDYSEFGECMYNILDYYLNHYSLYSKNVTHFDSLLPDTSRVQREFKELLNADSKLDELTSNAIRGSKLGDVHLDSVMVIFSRFYYLHRLKSGDLTVHTCMSVNEVFDLPQSELSPYLNALCWEVVVTNDIWGLIEGDFTWDHQLDRNIDDSTLYRIKEENYVRVQENEKVIETLLLEYEERKEFLNFNLIY